MIRRSDNEFQDICTAFGLMTPTWAWHPEMKAYDTSHESEALRGESRRAGLVLSLWPRQRSPGAGSRTLRDGPKSATHA